MRAQVLREMVYLLNFPFVISDLNYPFYVTWHKIVESQLLSCQKIQNSLLEQIFDLNFDPSETQLYMEALILLVPTRLTCTKISVCLLRDVNKPCFLSACLHSVHELCTSVELCLQWFGGLTKAGVTVMSPLGSLSLREVSLQFLLILLTLCSRPFSLHWILFAAWSSDMTL